MCRVLVPGDRFGALGQEFKVLDIDKANGDVLCIRTRRWKRAPFDEKTERDCTNDFGDASIRSLLSHVFFGSMIENDTDIDYFVKMSTDIVDNDGHRDYGMTRGYVRLLTQQEMVKYRKHLNIRDWAWTMTPLKCRRIFSREKHIGDQSVAIADSFGRWGHKKACYPADIYPVVTFKQRINRHQSFYLKVR